MPHLHALIDFAAAAADFPPLRLAFGPPVRELVAHHPHEVRPLLREVDALARAGAWCVGFLRYEAATAFEPRAAVHPADGPLAAFSVHRETLPWPDLEARGPARTSDWTSALDRPGFDAAIAHIHQAIADGEIYQANYTAPLQARFDGDPLALFAALRRAQPQANAAYLQAGDERILSVSPELFFDWQADGLLRSAPMKGTAPRGATPAEDAANARALRASAKEQAENVMIVDLIRNDLARVAKTGSVRVPRLFDCQAWPTVWQMVSLVEARTRPGTTLADVFQALYPCGSVTGAPKLRAMHWIRTLEPQPRGVYCGAIGVVQPGGAARFNVPIRTVTLRGTQARCGIGSGITADARAEAEWQEWGHKAAFLQQASQPFALLQTLRLQDGRWQHLDLHLDRLQRAAAQFGFAFDRTRALDEALAAAAGTASTRPARGRILVAPGGQVQVEVLPLPATPPSPVRARLADRAMEAPAAFLRHKTTRRAHYEAFEPSTPGLFDTLLWNARGELTEFTRGNLLLQRADGRIVTPPLHCGLLDGVGRAVELAAGRVQEEVVRVEDLPQARQLWFVNSMRGVVPVELVG